MRAHSAWRDDLVTIVALSVLAICTTDIAHEAVGHGSACLLYGGRIALLESAFFRCSATSPVIDIAGPAGNLLAGFAAFALQRSLPPTRPALRLYALCVMAFSLFWEAGYIIYASARGAGDYAYAWTGFVGSPGPAVRLGGALVGLAAYAGFSRLVILRCGVFADWPGRVSRLLRTAWFAGVLAMAGAASLFAPDRLGAVHDAALSAAASFPLLLPKHHIEGANPPARLIARDWRVIAAAIACFTLFALTMGRGIRE